MSSPVRTLGPVQTANANVNTKKRVLTDSEDTEERDPKRVRPQEDQTDISKRNDAKGKEKEKKKKRKKKRKVPVVQADDSDADTPATLHNARTRVRSRSILSAGPSTISPAPQTKVEELEARLPPAGPAEATVAPTSSASQFMGESIYGVIASQVALEEKCRATPDLATASLPTAPVTRAHASPKVKEEAATIVMPSTVDKGKARATSDGTATPIAQAQVTELQGQIAAKNKLVTEHEGLVSTLQQSLSCQICLDLMHRPFALSPCGHSACHQCLLNWFKAPPADVPANQVLPTWIRKKTCPHCRAVVKDRPIEIWAIKEMVANLVKSGLAQGYYSPAEEAADRSANADPWAGIFRPDRGNQAVFPDGIYPAPVAHLMGQRDDEDGVYRCIDCLHEIMDGVCSDCGRVYPGHDPEHELGSDYDDDDSLHDLWRDEEEQAWAEEHVNNRLFDYMPLPILPFLQHLNPFRHDNGSIDGDAGGDTEIDTDNEDAQVNWRRRLPRAAHVVELDHEEGEDEDGYESSFIDDGEVGPPRGHPGSPVHGDREATIELSDDDDEDEVQFVVRRRGLPRGRGPIVVDSDEDEDVDVSGDGPGHNLENDRHGSDEEHSYRSMSDRDPDEYRSDEEDLAGEVAAREYALYGDDGSVPRRNYAHRLYDEDYVSDEEDVSYHSDHTNGSRDDMYGYY